MNEKRFYTDAPEAYDYGYVTRTESPYELKHIDSYRTLFLVSMPAESADYQTGRYISGNYAVWTPSQLANELQYSFVREKVV